MADEGTADGQTGDAGTVSLAEYKSLQRKLDRANRSNKETVKEMAEIRAAQMRNEALTVSVLEMFGATDESLKPAVDGIKNQLSNQRQTDATTTGAEAQLRQTLDEADLDWESDKLGEARRVLSEYKRTGNVGLVPEIQRLVETAAKGGDQLAGGSKTDEEIEAMVQSRILDDRKATGRVDTGQSTAGDNTKPTMQTLADIDVLALGPRAAQAELDKFYAK